MPQRGTYQTRQQEAVCALFASRPEDCLTPRKPTGPFQSRFRCKQNPPCTAPFPGCARQGG